MANGVLIALTFLVLADSALIVTAELENQRRGISRLSAY